MIRFSKLYSTLWFLTICCQAAPFLDGTSSLVYQPVHQVFNAAGGAQSKAQGFVRLGNGFTILPDASFIFDTFVTVSGPIDLRETGTLILASDLNLEPGVTFSSGGIIDGAGFALKCEGNLLLPANKIFHVYSNTIIDGQGHALTVGDYGQLFIDNNVTLTLQNMVLKSGQKTNVFPPLRCAGSASQVTFDNVVLAAQGDLPFYQGKLYINNDVIFTGTSALIYNSPQTSFVMSGATLLFDHGTTFSYAPATTSRDLMQLQDATSKIVFDGATLKCTDTGLRLTTGSLLCDNKIGFDSVSGYSLSSLTTATSGYFIGNYGGGNGNWMKIRWHPSGRYFACSGDTLNGAAKVYTFNFESNTTTEVCRYVYSGANHYSFSVDWSPDGRFLAFGGCVNTGSTSDLLVLSFNGSSLALVTSLTITGWASSIAWSPDGRYIAVGMVTAGICTCNIYRFDGTSIVFVAGADDSAYNQTVGDVVWDHNGGYLAVPYREASQTWIYTFNGTSLVRSSWGAAGAGYGSSFSPDRKYLAVSTGNGDVSIAHSIYTASTWSEHISTRSYGGVAALCVRWSPDGKMLAIGGATNLLRTFLFNGSVEIPCIDCTLSPAPTSIMDLAWHPHGKYLAVIGKDGTHLYHYILSVGYVPPTDQAMTNSLVFGISSLSSSVNNLKVKMLSGARVEVRGQVLDDSF